MKGYVLTPLYSVSAVPGRQIPLSETSGWHVGVQILRMHHDTRKKFRFRIDLEERDANQYLRIPQSAFSIIFGCEEPSCASDLREIRDHQDSDEDLMLYTT